MDTIENFLGQIFIKYNVLSCEVLKQLTSLASVFNAEYADFSDGSVDLSCSYAFAANY